MNAGPFPLPGTIGLSPAQFDAVFPFHLAVDAGMRVLQAGPSLRRICPAAMPGAPLAGLFALVRPDIPLAFEPLRAAAGSVTLWRNLETGLKFRGQVLPLDQPPALVFLWSPWLSDSADLTRYGLQFDDFALHDPIVDMLQVIQSHRLALQDVRNLSGKLAKQRADLSRANQTLQQQFALVADAQKRLRIKEAEARKLALVASRTDNGVILTDAEGKVEWVNEGFVRITGYTLAEMLGNTPGSMLQGKKSDHATIEHMRQRLRNRQGFNVELLNYSKEGREYWIHIEAQPILDDEGHVANFMAIERDITGIKRNERMLVDAKREAESANQAKSAFLAAMSHEIRTPMNAILGTLELLVESPLDDEQRTWTKTAHESARALLMIISDILDFSKIEAGKLPLHAVDFELRAVLEDIAQLFRQRAAAKGLAFAFHIAPKVPPYLRGDPFRLRQILVNLIGNAVKFTEQGRIEVGVTPMSCNDAHACLHFHVRDSGIGIAPEALGNLFNEFVQVEPDGARRYAGTGLGLAIAKRLAQLMDGDIGVESAPGRGSDFWFTARLKVAKDASPAPEPARADGSARPPASGRILVAEDGAANRLVITTLLGKAGYAVAAVHDGAAAVEAVRGGDYDLILMDLQMPVMDGFEATAEIRAMPGGKSRFPIVALTANALMETRNACLAAGMDDFITKPVEKERLLSTVAQWLRAPQPPRPVAREAPPPPLLDDGLLGILVDNTDAETMRMVVAAFFSEMPQHLEQIEAGRKARALDILEGEAHTLKSSARLIGAARLAQALCDLEDACKQGRPESALAWAQACLDLCAATREAYVRKGALADGTG